MNNSRSIAGISIIAGILLFAIWLGVSIVTDQIQTLAYAAGGSALIICALLGRRIWMIIPFLGTLNLSLNIAGQPNTLLVGQTLFVGFCCLLFLMRKLPYKIKITELEIWMLLVTICVIQVYLRNPVGLNILGGASVGARPYALYASALISSIILANLRVEAADLRWIMRLSIIAGLMNFFLLAVANLFPRVGMWYAPVDFGSESTGIKQGEYGVNYASRIGFVRDIARNLSLWISSFISPVRACIHPFWCPLVLLSLAFAAFSGYRNEIGAVGLTYFVAIAYRGGIISVIAASCTLIIGISLLAIINIAAPLPANVQRSLSFLPGTWDDALRQDAADSTQWRVDMWKEALLSDYWIHDKWLGDGLGMTKEELDRISSFEGKQISGAVGTGKLTIHQELMMSAGNYHSGPINTIRTTGYVGLVILVLAQIRLAVRAHRQINRARNTEWLQLTLLIGIPLVWAPIFFIFIIGDFATATSSLLLGIALIRLLENNLPLPDYTKGRQIIHKPKQPAAV